MCMRLRPPEETIDRSAPCSIRMNRPSTFPCQAIKWAAVNPSLGVVLLTHSLHCDSVNLSRYKYKERVTVNSNINLKKCASFFIAAEWSTERP